MEQFCRDFLYKGMIHNQTKIRKLTIYIIGITKTNFTTLSRLGDFGANVETRLSHP